MKQKKWIMLNTFFLIVWISFSLISLYLQKINIFNKPTAIDFYSAYKFILFPFSIITLLFAYFTRYKYYLYLVLSLSWGLGCIFADDYVFGIIVFLSSVAIFYRIKPNLYKTRKFPTTALVTEFLICCLVIFIKTPTFNTFLFLSSKLIAFILLLSLYTFMLYPLFIQKAESINPTLDCSLYNYTDTQKTILIKALKGDKYDSISQDVNIPVPKVKKIINRICRDLDVQDKTMLISKYSHYNIL